MLSNWTYLVEKRFLDRGWPKMRDAKKCLYEPNIAIFKAAYLKICDTCGEVFLVDDIACGAWVGEQISPQCMGVYSLVAHTNIFNLSYFVLLKSLIFARSKGLRYVTLGGSESESLFRFKSIARSGPDEFCYERMVHDLTVDTDKLP
jgi:hypothetical protein